MDKQIRNSEKPITIEGFISALEDILSGIAMPEEKVEEIKKHLNSGNTDLHILQSIIGIMISIPDTEDNKDIIRLRNQLSF